MNITSHYFIRMIKVLRAEKFSIQNREVADEALIFMDVRLTDHRLWNNQ